MSSLDHSHTASDGQGDPALATPTAEPTLLTHAATESDTRPAHRFSARFVLWDGALHPVIFYGAELPELRERALAWWHAQIELAKRRTGLSDEQIEAMKAGKARARAAKLAKALGDGGALSRPLASADAVPGMDT